VKGTNVFNDGKINVSASPTEKSINSPILDIFIDKSVHSLSGTNDWQIYLALIFIHCNFIIEFHQIKLLVFVIF